MFKNCLFKTFAAAALAVFAVAACKPDPKPTPTPTPEPGTLTAPVLSASAQSVTLSQASETSTALTLTWTAATGTDGDIAYTVFANVAGKDLYTNPERLAANGNLTFAFTHKELNDLAAKLGVSASGSLQFAVYAVPEDKEIDPVISNVKEVAVTTYSETVTGPEQMIIAGSAVGGWDLSSAARMPKISDNVYELENVEVRLSPDDVGFKFYFSADGSDSREVAQDPSSATFGDCKIFDTDAPSLFQPARNGYAAGMFTIKLDLNQLKMTMTRTGDLPAELNLPDNLYMKGDCLPWGWSTPAILLSKDSGKTYKAEGVAFSFNEGDPQNPCGFKIFLADDSWSPYIAMSESSTDHNIILEVINEGDGPQVYPGKVGYTSGTYNIVADFDTMTMTLTAVQSTTLGHAYLYGCAFTDYTDWADWIELTETAAGSNVFTISDLRIKAGEGDYNYGFKVYPAVQDWGNEYRCDRTKSTDASNIFIEHISSVEGDYQVCPLDYGLGSGTYDVTVDFNTKKVTFTAK